MRRLPNTVNDEDTKRVATAGTEPELRHRGKKSFETWSAVQEQFLVCV